MRIKRRRNKLSGLIIILVILLLGISIGYASFSSTLNIIGTANANGNFSIEFIKGTIIDSQGIDSANSKVLISDTKDTLSINIANMAYPGAGATISCMIKNTGTIPAKLTDVRFSGNTDPDISVTFPESLATGKTLDAGETVAISFVVKWNMSSTITSEKKINFTATLVYEQDVSEYKGSVK